MTTQFQDGSVTQNGGVTRYVHGQETAPIVNPLTEAWSASGRTGTGTVSVNMRTGESEVKGRAVYCEATDQASRPGVMASFQSHNGGTVMVDGMRTSMAVAKRLGAVVADGQGGYQDVSLGKEGGHNVPAPEAITTPQDPLTIPQTLALQPAEHFDEAEWKAFEGDIQDMPQVAYDTTVSVATVACLDGTSLDAAAARLARETGMEPARAAHYVEHSAGMFRDTVTRAVAAEGVALENVDAFYAWCRGQRGLQNAIGALTSSRNVKPFQSMAREWTAKQARHQGVNA